jgi:hypothetical protein
MIIRNRFDKGPEGWRSYDYLVGFGQESRGRFCMGEFEIRTAASAKRRTRS